MVRCGVFSLLQYSGIHLVSEHPVDRDRIPARIFGYGRLSFSLQPFVLCRGRHFKLIQLSCDRGWPHAVDGPAEHLPYDRGSLLIYDELSFMLRIEPVAVKSPAEIPALFSQHLIG